MQTYLSDSPQAPLGYMHEILLNMFLLRFFIPQGSKGNKIFYKGSGDTTSEVAEPKIQPWNLDELTPDEQDLVKLQIEQNRRGNVNVDTQTVRLLLLDLGTCYPR